MLFAQDQVKPDSLNTLLESAEHDTTRAKLLNNIGIIYYNQGNYEQALDYYSKSLKIKEELGDNEGIPSTLSNIGIIYYLQG